MRATYLSAYAENVGERWRVRSRLFAWLLEARRRRVLAPMFIRISIYARFHVATLSSQSQILIRARSLT